VAERVIVTVRVTFSLVVQRHTHYDCVKVRLWPSRIPHHCRYVLPGVTLFTIVIKADCCWDLAEVCALLSDLVLSSTARWWNVGSGVQAVYRSGVMLDASTMQSGCTTQ